MSKRLPQLVTTLTVISLPSFANFISNGGTGGIVMGVSGYGGAPNVGGPTYIANNSAIPIGDVISVLSTLTAYSDPANFDSILPTLDLLNFTGTLASLDLVSTTTTPEPGTWMLLGAGLLIAMPLRRRRSDYAAAARL